MNLAQRIGQEFKTLRDDELNPHLADTSNPHSVTKAQVGLGNVDNTSDSAKPISTLTQAALNLKADKSDTYTKSETDNVVSTAINGIVDSAPGVLNTLNELAAALNDDANFATTVSNSIAGVGDDLDAHITDTSNPHLVTKAQVGLGNVDNTSDANKPISTLTQNALNGKVDVVAGKALSTNDYTTVEKTKLAGIATNANNYSLPTASATVLGGIKIGTNLSIDANGVVSANDTSIDWSEVQNKPDPVVTVTLTGDVTGSANATLTDLASGTISVATTIAANSVALGTDTTGNYVADVTAGSYVLKSGTAGEGWSPSIAVDATSANTASKVVARDTSGNFSAGTITASLSGNAATATKLATARTISLTGGVTGSASFDGSANISIDTTAGASIPSGVIVLWSGATTAVPSGWALCNGANGTPNLQDRFVVGAGSSYAVGDTGGSKDAIVVSHSHTGSTDTTGGHNHLGGSRMYNNVTAQYGRVDQASLNTIGGWVGSNQANHLAYTSTNGAHSHSITVGSTGSSGTNANLPPYYALAYIMKL